MASLYSNQKLKDALCSVEYGINKLSVLVDDSACLHTRLAYDLQSSLESVLFECMHRYSLYCDTLLTVAYSRSFERFVPQSPTDIPPNRPELSERSAPSSPIILSDSSDSTLVDVSTASHTSCILSYPTRTTVLSTQMILRIRLLDRAILF